MNSVILIGRLTRDPDIRYTTGENATCIAKYTLAVDRTFNHGEKSADFISCVVFGKGAELAEKYMKKGVKIAVSGKLQTGHYTHRDGYEVYTTDVVVDRQEFVESKSATLAMTEKDDEENNNVNSRNDDLPFS